jgi:hypothetical protein
VEVIGSNPIAPTISFVGLAAIPPEKSNHNGRSHRFESYSAHHLTRGKQWWLADSDFFLSTEVVTIRHQLRQFLDRLWHGYAGRCASLPRALRLRVADGGRIFEECKTDGVGAFACMLGGEDGRALFASVAPTFHEAEASANPHASILMTRVEVPHAGLPWRCASNQYPGRPWLRPELLLARAKSPAVVGHKDQPVQLPSFKLLARSGSLLRIGRYSSKWIASDLHPAGIDRTQP